MSILKHSPILYTDCFQRIPEKDMTKEVPLEEPATIKDPKNKEGAKPKTQTVTKQAVAIVPECYNKLSNQIQVETIKAYVGESVKTTGTLYGVTSGLGVTVVVLLALLTTRGRKPS